ncbi:dimethyl sulfoxide reductase anchor subunit [Phyllobacterium sp. 0TCS1.6C]|uniref:dimethyl sulfoxide reductase anchor subunit family protein n=1 Tax=unclassified Phyllobacterium TaxID=2638441 RepID=UPI002263E4A4|nr:MULTISPECIES: DmsC/YnfH family molybdoenzyme membrane anchor subunit [unclassified Phyllobacterium]MCX8279454.1 dimethyl sulfoxide reductase anchor subunit [Phyllobacterium sp. 0TCS1.6C]MCX8292355.1 dimethyl sulfoxide reductase anchor subunit [Phyllobacterium sp. 0TCS1.6A]
MHPAYSMIIFTVLSGLGYGLAVVLGLGGLEPSLPSTVLAHILALVLIAAGLIASLFHLGNPQRAWRALSQWRSSWLSREGVMALGTFVPLTLDAGLLLFTGQSEPILGYIGAAGAMLTVFCTSMIYTSLKSIDAWHSALTPACFLLLSLTGGVLLAACFAPGTRLLAGAGLLLLLGAMGCKLAWRRRMLRNQPLSTPESATGLGDIGRVRLFERPHTLDNYLTREMGYRVARKHSAKLWAIALVCAFLLPAALLLLSLALGGLPLRSVLVFAVLSHSVGVLVERWLFFAEARHAVMNYY